MLAIGAVTLLATGCTSSDPQYVSMVTTQAEIVQQAADEFGTHFSGGEFESSDYFTSDWEKYQLAAVADASLGAIPSGDLSSEQQSLQPGYRETAISTVDQAIATHQLSDGDFDDGTPSSGSSGVNGGFWAEAEGGIALMMAPYASAAEQANWITSMENYSDYLWTTQLDPNTYAAWYTNGNVVLRETVILLETYLLSRDSTYYTEYTTAKEFLNTPGALTSRWTSEGWMTGGGGTGWFTESTTSVPDEPITCANNVTPCDGFDPNYTMVQLDDLIVAYELSNDPTWLSEIEAEYAKLEPLITSSNTSLNASDGSRDNDAAEIFYPPVYEVFDSRNLRGADDTAWSEQQRAYAASFSASASQADPGPDAFSLAAPAALGLVDAWRAGSPSKES